MTRQLNLTGMTPKIEIARIPFVQEDLIVYGSILACVASAAGFIPLWISKAGEFVAVLFLAIAILYLFRPIGDETDLNGASQSDCANLFSLK